MTNDEEMRQAKLAMALGRRKDIFGIQATARAGQPRPGVRQLVFFSSLRRIGSTHWKCTKDLNF